MRIARSGGASVEADKRASASGRPVGRGRSDNCSALPEQIRIWALDYCPPVDILFGDFLRGGR